jgi:hypothetical protein
MAVTPLTHYYVALGRLSKVPREDCTDSSGSDVELDEGTDHAGTPRPKAGFEILGIFI